MTKGKRKAKEPAPSDSGSATVPQERGDTEAPEDTERGDYDYFFKRLFERFFPQFLPLFAPEKAAKLDMEQTDFMDKEVPSETGKGKPRHTDILVKVYLKQPAESGRATKAARGKSAGVICIHIELQAQPETGFHERMLRYFVEIRRKHGLPVFPIVVYLRATPGVAGKKAGVGYAEYREAVLDEQILTFKYLAIGLPDLKAEDYLDHPLALARGLAALMRPPANMTKPEFKLACLERIAQATRIPDEDHSMLVNLVQTYLTLNRTEEQTFTQLVQSQEGVQTMRLTYFGKLEAKAERKGKKEGIKEGIKEGRLIQGREILQRLLTSKFGEQPTAVIQRIETLSDERELQRLLDLVLQAQSFKEMGLGEDQV